MKRVWLVIWSCFDESDVWGVFDSEEAAVAAATGYMAQHVLGRKGERVHIERVPLNPTAEQDQHRRSSRCWEGENPTVIHGPDWGETT